MKIKSLGIFILGISFLLTNCEQEDKKYTLTLSTNLENAGITSGEGVYEEGKEISISVIPNSNFSFVNWTDGANVISTSPNFNYTMPSRDLNLTANFKNVYNILLNTNIPNAGNLTGEGTYEPGQEITLTANANDGYLFVNWTEGANILSTKENFKYTVPSRNVTLTANFIDNFNTITIEPDEIQGKDALIFSYNPDNNFGTSTDFSAIAWTHSGTPVNIRTLIQFDFSSLPSDITIHKVMLYLYSYNTSSNGNHSTISGSNAAVLRRVTSSWEESTVTWNNQPSSTNVDEVILPESSYATQNYIVDITESAKYMIENPSQNFGYMLKLQNESYYRALIFASSDNSISRPKVVVSYTTNK